MLRVLHLADRLSAWGGADRHMIAVLERLQGRARTLLAVGRDDGGLPPAERAVIGPMVRLKGLDRGGLSPRGQGAAVARLERLVQDFRPELIHIHNVVDPALLARAAQLAPSVITVQDHRHFCPGRGKMDAHGRPCGQVMGPDCLACFDDREYGQRLLELTQRRLAALAAMGRVLVLSGYMAAELERAGLAQGLATVLPPFAQGVAPPAAATPAAHHLLACRLVGRKGVRVALAAAEMLSGPWPLVVAGTGPLADEVAAGAARSKGRIIFAGWADRPGMSRLLAGARGLWLPSLWAEPFGIVGLEALHLGVPVLAARVGGVADWLDDGLAGRLLPPGDAQALAAAANALDQDDAARQAMGRHGMAVSRSRFDPSALMERLLQTYRQAAGQAEVG